jgi:translation initiation factor IF-3
METREALRLAHTRGLDLIEVSPGARPPVCKIGDYGKFKYEREKGERERGKKHHREGGFKNIRIGFSTGRHDLTLRAEQAKKFLEGGDKIRIDMRLRGREKALSDFAFQRFRQFLELIPAEFSLEMPPKKFPQGISALIVKK